jgi:protein-L-isoaspartate(D-aspartate) O-methyltransferase
LADAARERLRSLGYSNIEIIAADGSEGYAPEAPFQAIVVTAGAPKVPQPLLDQLGDGGRMVIPVGDRRQQELLLIFKSESQTATRDLGPCQFVPLIGKSAWLDETGVRG